MEMVLDVWKKHKFGLLLTTSIILLVISILAQSSILLVVSGAATIILLVTMFIRFLVRESSNGNAKKLLIAFAMIAGVVCIVIAIIGYIAINNARMTPSEFDQLTALGEGLGGGAYMRSYGGFSYMAAKNRVLFIVIGLLLIFGPIVLNAVLSSMKNAKGTGAGAGYSAQRVQTNRQVQSNHVARQTEINPPPVFHGEACCICGGSLQSGHAVLFTRSNGTDAKIDENCWNVIDAIFNTQDQRQLLHATRALHVRLNSVDQEVGQCLQGYIEYGNQRMTQM